MPDNDEQVDMTLKDNMLDEKRKDKHSSKVKPKKKLKSKGSRTNLNQGEIKHILDASSENVDTKTSRKTADKQKSKHRKHKKHKKNKTTKVGEITDSEMKDDEDKSDEDDKESDVMESEPYTQLTTEGNNDTRVIINNVNDDSVVRNNTPLDDVNAATSLPGTVNHVHFQEEKKTQSRSGSVSDTDIKRG